MSLNPLKSGHSFRRGRIDGIYCDYESQSPQIGAFLQTDYRH